MPSAASSTLADLTPKYPTLVASTPGCEVVKKAVAHAMRHSTAQQASPAYDKVNARSARGPRPCRWQARSPPALSEARTAGVWVHGRGAPHIARGACTHRVVGTARARLGPSVGARGDRTWEAKRMDGWMLSWGGNHRTVHEFRILQAFQKSSLCRIISYRERPQTACNFLNS